MSRLRQFCMACATVCNIQEANISSTTLKRWHISSVMFAVLLMAQRVVSHAILLTRSGRRTSEALLSALRSYMGVAHELEFECGPKM